MQKFISLLIYWFLEIYFTDERKLSDAVYIRFMKQFSFRNQTKYYQGKVRDVYTIADTWIVMIASDRISAFDVILPKTIPFKGQVLNQIAAYMLNAT